MSSQKKTCSSSETTVFSEEAIAVLHEVSEVVREEDLLVRGDDHVLRGRDFSFSEASMPFSGDRPSPSAADDHVLGGVNVVPGEARFSSAATTTSSEGRDFSSSEASMSSQEKTFSAADETTSSRGHDRLVRHHDRLIGHHLCASLPRFGASRSPSGPRHFARPALDFVAVDLCHDVLGRPQTSLDRGRHVTEELLDPLIPG